MSSGIKPLSTGDQALLDHLTEIFAEHGGSMTAAKFDEIFCEKEFGPRDGAHCQGWNGDDILWGGINGGDWAQWLDLLQYAVHVGVASREIIPKHPSHDLTLYHLPAKTC